MKTKYIDLFCQQTGLRFESKGEIGFGRNCVGIVNDKTESYIAYMHYDSDTYKEIMRHDVAAGATPEDAYHKGPYLAVLYDGSDEGREKAIEQLEGWIEKIMAAHYELTPYTETNSVASLFTGGAVTQLCLTGGVKYAKFVEIF